MALKNRCVACDHIIEAPEDRRGQEVVCPRCEAVNVLQAPEDVARRRVEDRLAQERERRRFLRSLEARGRPTPEGDGPGAWRAPVELAPSHEAAILAGRRLKDVSVYLLASAYLLLVLALVLGVVLGLWARLPGAWSAFAFLAGAFCGVLAFVFFKFMSDTVRALADLGDLARAIDGRLSEIETLVTEPLAEEGLEPEEPAEADQVLSSPASEG